MEKVKKGGIVLRPGSPPVAKLMARAPVRLIRGAAFRCPPGPIWPASAFDRNRYDPAGSIMALYARQIARFLRGSDGPEMTVAFLPGALGAHIGTLETDVRLRLDYAKKLIPRMANYQIFSEIQNTIDQGLCMLEAYNELSFICVKDNVAPEIYFLLVKTTGKRDELWLKTFYRITKAQYFKKLKPGRILRGHAEKEFLG